MEPTRTRYADVNGITLYHEIYGKGEPLVLIHGGLTTIGEMQDWVQPLASTRQVIAVEMQGHGHTADTDRPLSFSQLGDDIVALLDDLGIPSADVAGHSFGGAVAIRAAIQSPRRVRRLVVISSPHAGRSCACPAASCRAESASGCRSAARVAAAVSGDLGTTCLLTDDVFDIVS